MKKIIAFLCCFVILISSVCVARVYVKGYYRKDGTYVAPHYRSDPDGIVTNNYSYPGNYNPNTGEITGGTPNYTPSYSSPITSTPLTITNYTPTKSTPVTNKITATIPTYDVKINNKDISNYSMGWTPLIYKDITYLPMTSYLVNALDLNLTYDNTNGFSLTKNTTLKTEKEKFLDDYIVIVPDDGTNLYHKYGCWALDLSEFWAYNVEQAIVNGYKACSYCN